MAFFRSLQQSLPSVTSILDSVSSTVDDLATAMSDVTYQVSDQLTEQVTTIINKVQAEEDERARKEEEERAKKEEEEAAAYREEKRSRRKKRGYRGPEDSGGDNSTGSTNSTEEERARKEEEERMMKEEEERTKKEEEEAAAYQEEKRSCRKKRGYRGPEDSGGDYSMGYAHSTEAERARKEEEEQAWKEEEERAKKEEEEAEAYQEEKRSRRKKRGYRGPEDSGGDYSMGYAHSTEAERARKEEEERAKKEEGQECSYPTSKGGSRRNREQSCNGSASPSEDTPRRRSHQDAREEEPGDVETSSSPQHQRTRKNRDGQCGERANGLHHSNSQEEPQEETATQESTSPDTTRAAAKKKKKKGEPDIEEEESPEKAESTSKSETKKKKKGQASVEEEECPAEEGTPRAATKKKKGKAKSEEEESSAKEQGNDSEQEPSSQKPGKRGKSSAVEKREEKGKSRRGSSREEERPRKSSKKDRSCPDRGSSESEDERPKRPDQRARGWDSSHKHTAENEGYSSEASNGQANSVQRVRCSSPMNELQPPPYQDEDAARRKSRGHPGSGGGSGSEGSGDPDDTESYLNKGYEEDAPSDSTAVLGPEDGSLPTGYEPEALGKYGTLDVAFEYDSGEQRLAVTVTAATDIPALKTTGNIAWQVHLVLLPTKKQRAKTGVQKGPCPVFTETFRFSRVEQDTLADYAVRFRLYSVRRMKKEKVLGEKVLYLTKLNLQGKMALPVTLEPGSAVTGCGSMVSVSRSAGAVSYRSTGDSSTPEILLGLLYNSTTGRLSAEVIKGSHFKNNATDNPPSLFCCIKQFIGGQLYIMRDTYVKLTMLDSKGKQMSKCKTSVCRGQPSPTYKETFVFQVALFQLSEVTLQVSVHSRRSSVKRRERVGWVSLGLSSTGEEQEEHWAQMKEAEGQQVCQWHTLLDS